MQLKYPYCAGLDVHKKSVVACLRTPAADGTINQQLRTFGTMTADLLVLADWLKLAGCTHVAMESTGVYWKPVYNILEAQFQVFVVNAAHYKAVPGRKTDVKDAEWLAELLQHGLLKPSFVPEKPQRELRELTRYRQSLVAERARTINRLQKVLEGANIKLASVVSDVTGVSARAMLEGLLDEAADPAALAELARLRMRKKIAELQQALTGQVGEHHRLLLEEILGHIDHLDGSIARLSKEIEERLRPFGQLIELLDGVPGINRRIAQIILAEVGTDVERFPSAKHLASWAGLCPGNDQSAGKVRNGKTRKGTTWLRQALVEAAHGASKTKGSALAAQYRRMVGRLGKKQALIAVAHSILVSVYHIISEQESYKELGADYYVKRSRENSERRALRVLAQLGYRVELHPMAAAKADTEAVPADEAA